LKGGEVGAVQQQQHSGGPRAIAKTHFRRGLDWYGSCGGGLVLGRKVDVVAGPDTDLVFNTALPSLAPALN